MIVEKLKICGLSKNEISERLDKVDAKGLTFEIEEDCLDACITLSSELNADKFGILKSRIYNAFEEEVYSPTDIRLEELAAKLLKLNKRRLSVAESLTGGEVCSRLISQTGISMNFYEGIVCYDIHAKTQRLGVSEKLLDKFGAISRETAYAMVQGITANKEVDLGLSTTGLAGPDADEGKPVGLVYIGVGVGDFITVFERHLKGTRNEIRTATANLALFYLIRYLKGDILRL